MSEQVIIFVILFVIVLVAIASTIFTIRDSRKSEARRIDRMKCLEEEKAKPHYVVEIETESHTYISNPFEPKIEWLRYSGGYVVRSKAVAERCASPSNGCIKIPVVDDEVLIPVERCLSIRVREDSVGLN